MEFPHITSQPWELPQTVPCFHVITHCMHRPHTHSPPTSTPQQRHMCVFIFFSPSFLLMSPPLYRYRGLPLTGNLRGGIVPLLFMALVHLFFSFSFPLLTVHSLLHVHNHPASSSRITFTMSPLSCCLRHMLHLPPLTLRVALHSPLLASHIAPVVSCCIPPLSHITLLTCRLHRVPCRAALCTLAPSHQMSLLRHTSRIHHMLRCITPSSRVPLVKSPLTSSCCVLDLWGKWRGISGWVGRESVSWAVV